MGKLLSRPVLLPLAILLPTMIIAGIIFLAGTFRIPGGPVNYSLFFPHGWLNSSFTFLTVASYSIAAIGISRFWKDLQKVDFGTDVRSRSFWSGFWKVKNEILAHSRFSKCEQNRSRKFSHFLVFYGFLLLLLVTLYAIYAAVTEKYPLAFSNPFKVLGNLASLMLLAGLGIMILNRLFRKEGTERSSYSDWLLIVALFLLTVSGVIIETARFMDWSFAYHFYFFHLVCVWFVIIYLPYTKFGHVIYRTVAMTYAFTRNRK
jgi:quinone-modifying oxidoreductase subunit QmoC